MGRHAAFFSALSLSLVNTAAKQQALFEATSSDNLSPATTYFIAAKAKTIPTACDVYCPARAVCDRCWRGRCDYEGQDQLCFGCAESSCYNERILQNSNYREAKLKSTNAAIAMAAAAAMAQDYNLEGQVYDSNKTKNSRGGSNKNRALVIIQNDRAARVAVSDDGTDYHPSKGGNIKPKKNTASLLSVNPTVLSFNPQPQSEKRRAGHIPDTSTQQLSAIVDQRVWVPVTSYGVYEELRPRRQVFFDEEALGQRSRPLTRLPGLSTLTATHAPESSTTTTTTTQSPSNQLDDSRSSVLLKPILKRARATSGLVEAAAAMEIEQPIASTSDADVHDQSKREVASPILQNAEKAEASEEISETVIPQSPESATGSGDLELTFADAYRPNEELIGSEIEEPSAVLPIAIASLVETVPTQARLVGGLRRGGLMANLLRPSATASS